MPTFNIAHTSNLKGATVTRSTTTAPGPSRTETQSRLVAVTAAAPVLPFTPDLLVPDSTAVPVTSPSSSLLPSPSSSNQSRAVPVDFAPSNSPLSKDEPAPSPSFGEKVRDIMYDNQVVVNTFIAGGLAGATSRTVVSPLERLKIILQVQTKTHNTAAGEAYGGIWKSLVRMWKEEGFRGFMKGNGINVVRILPYSALQFTSYGGFKSLLSNWSGEERLSTPLRLLAGGAAGIVAVSATYPLDLVRARLSIVTANISRGAGKGFTAEDARLGMVGMTKKVYRTEGGVRGLYRGCWATALGVAPYVSLNFYIYESLKTRIIPPELQADEAELAIRKLACGGLAGATALLFTHPFDVLRRKLQVVGMSGANQEQTGAIAVLRNLIRAEGFWRGMYRGLTPNIIKVAPSIAVSFYTFETVKDLLARWEHIEPDHYAV